MRHWRHGAFYVSIAVGALVAAGTMWLVPGWAVTVAGAAFFSTYLAMALARLPQLTAEYLSAHADEADAPVAVIFVATAGIVGVCVVSLFQLLNSGQHDFPQLALSIASVMLGWFVVHTMAAYHYAYEYYETGDDGGCGGLDFPGKAKPDGTAFLYFAYVIGMTAQVADVAVASNKMRRLVLIHGIFSFFFNTVIVAATVNVVVAVGGH